MMRVSAAIRRWLLASLLALSIISVAASLGHNHPGVKSDACSICKAVSENLDAPAAVVAVWPPSALSEYIAASYCGVAIDFAAHALGSRAPPVV